jgi:putative transposase
MELYYDIAKSCRQGFSQWKQPSVASMERVTDTMIVEMARRIRKFEMPGSSAREVYKHICEEKPKDKALLKGCGKHRFERVCFAHGMRVEFRRFVPKTTVKGDFQFDNKIAGMELNGTVIVLVCDICYLYGSNGKLLGYATLVTDLYTKQLLGLAFSRTMHAEQTAHVAMGQAIEALKLEKLVPTKDCPNPERELKIYLHTDGGKQFIEKQFLKMLKQYGIESSMAGCCYENATAESMNDILKNHILPEFTINSFPQLKELESFIKKCYNNNRPHGRLKHPVTGKMMTPSAFASLISNIQPCQRTTLKVKAVKRAIYVEVEPKSKSTEKEAVITLPETLLANSNVVTAFSTYQQPSCG